MAESLTRLCHEAPVTIGDMVVTPVVRLETAFSTVGGRSFAYVSKTPVALLFRTPSREWRIELPAPEALPPLSQPDTPRQ